MHNSLNGVGLAQRVKRATLTREALQKIGTLKGGLGLAMLEKENCARMQTPQPKRGTSEPLHPP